MLGAGKTEGAMDAANMLKPMLARGELRCIGATTIVRLLAMRALIASSPPECNVDRLGYSCL